MSDPIDVERDLFGHVAAAHLRTGNSLRIRSRIQDTTLVAVPVGLIYDVCEQALSSKGVVTDSENVPYKTARAAVQRILDIHKRWRVPLGDAEFSNKAGTIAVTWRHLRVRLPALRWVLNDDGTIIAGILEEATHL